MSAVLSSYFNVDDDPPFVRQTGGRCTSTVSRNTFEELTSCASIDVDMLDEAAEAAVKKWEAALCTPVSLTEKISDRDGQLKGVSVSLATRIREYFKGDHLEPTPHPHLQDLHDRMQVYSRGFNSFKVPSNDVEQGLAVAKDFDAKVEQMMEVCTKVVQQ